MWQTKVKTTDPMTAAEKDTSRTMVLRSFELADAEMDAALPNLRRIKISKPR